jgi:N-acetylmuramoyl-L-alanine amidase
MISKKSINTMAWIAAAMMAAGVSLSAWAQQTITAVNLAPEASSTRVVLNLTGPVAYKLFTLDNPRRVVVDIKDVRDSHPAIALPSDAVVSGVRTAVQAGDDLRMVFDVRDSVAASAFAATPDASGGHRLVLTLRHAPRAVANSYQAQPVPAKPVKVASPAPADTQGIGAKPVLNPLAAKPAGVPVKVAMATPVPLGTGVSGSPASAPGKGRDVVVAVDAGHGGQDPGAIGPKGAHEKVVTLAISMLLVEELNRQRGVKAKLVRTGDYFIPLKTRRDIARTKLNADLFVSIHADAALRRSARGASVFALSRNGATSSLAQVLADRENEADLVGGLSVKDDMVASVIADLALEGQMEHSSKVGSRVLRELGGVATLHKRQIEKAGFAVLKSADFPSILVETGFISNPQEEANLTNRAHQQKLARAITRGVMGYFGDHPPPATWLAWQRETKGSIPAVVTSPVSPDAVLASNTSPVAARKADTKAPAKPVVTAASRPAIRSVAKSSPKSAPKAPAKLSAHRISRGETLAGIADRYDVELADLRRANAIRNDNLIRIGQVLTIPDT